MPTHAYITYTPTISVHAWVSPDPTPGIPPHSPHPSHMQTPVCPLTSSLHLTPSLATQAQFGFVCACTSHGGYGHMAHHHGHSQTTQTPATHPHALYILHSHSWLLPQELSHCGAGGVLWCADHPDSSTNAATLPWAQPWLGKVTAHTGISVSQGPHSGVGITSVLGVTRRSGAGSWQSLAYLCQAPQWIEETGDGRGVCSLLTVSHPEVLPGGCGWGPHTSLPLHPIPTASTQCP